MAGTPGDYGVGFPTFLGKVSDPAAKKSKLNAELANGRLAMMAIIGMFFQDGLVLSLPGMLLYLIMCFPVVLVLQKHAEVVFGPLCLDNHGISNLFHWYPFSTHLKLLSNVDRLVGMLQYVADGRILMTLCFGLFR